jgi:hypothetical protein
MVMTRLSSSFGGWCVFAILFFIYAPNTNAHHSFSAVFDRDRQVDLQGIVTKVEWRNPHVWFYVDVDEGKGEVENWAFELGSPNALIRRGWSHNTLQVGSQVTVHSALARDGSLRGAVLTVSLPSGQNLFGAQGQSR